MSDKDLSKFLSLILRHQPQVLGIELDQAGWTPVDALLAKMNLRGMNVTLEQLKGRLYPHPRQSGAFGSRRFGAEAGYSTGSTLPRHGGKASVRHSCRRTEERLPAARTLIGGRGYGKESRSAARKTGGLGGQQRRNEPPGNRLLPLGKRGVADR
jgi:hypothetical protein